MEIQEIVGKFAVEGTISEIKPLGNGLINDTYIVRTAESDAPDYVLQRINHNVFTNVEGLQGNIVAVTNHLRHKLEEQGAEDVNRRVLTPVMLADDPKRSYFFDGEGYYRMMLFIDNAVTVNEVSPHYAEMAGEAFGRFQADLVDIKETLVETIPDFHNMEFRLQQLRQAMADDKAGRLESVKDIADALMARADEMCAAEQLYRQGLLPKRICHCDTKVNNMMFDKEGNVLCVIDLDTVMPSFVFSDFGDFLRTAANSAAEDEADLSKVHFKKDIYEAFRKGYLRSAGGFLTDLEVEMLPYAVKLFPYMQAVRFFADYLNGDTYYKTRYADHNLVRTRCQMQLLSDIDAQL